MYNNKGDIMLFNLIYASNDNVVLLILILVIVLGIAGYYFTKMILNNRKEMKEAQEKSEKRSQERRERRIKTK